MQPETARSVLSAEEQSVPDVPRVEADARLRLPGESARLAAVDLFPGEQFRLVIDQVFRELVPDFRVPGASRWRLVLYFRTPPKERAPVGVLLHKSVPLVWTNVSLIRCALMEDDPRKWVGREIIVARLEEPHQAVDGRWIPAALRFRAVSDRMRPRAQAKPVHEARDPIEVLLERAEKVASNTATDVLDGKGAAASSIASKEADGARSGGRRRRRRRRRGGAKRDGRNVET